MKVIVIERFRDLTVKSKKYPQGKDREINEILDVEESRGKILLDKGWVKVEDNTHDENKNQNKKGNNLKDKDKKDNTQKDSDDEKTTEDTNSDNHDTEDNDSDEKTIEDTNSDKVKSENK